MGSNTNNVLILLLLLVVISLITLPQHSNSKPNSSLQMTDSNSDVLVALLDSHYTELVGLIHKAVLLRNLEEAIRKHKHLTILDPRNEAFNRDLDPEFKRFLHEPNNLKSLQDLVLFHIVPSRVHSQQWPRHPRSTRHSTLISNDGDEHIYSTTFPNPGRATILLPGHAEVIHPDSVTRPEIIIHGIQRRLVQRSIHNHFHRLHKNHPPPPIAPAKPPEEQPPAHPPSTGAGSEAQAARNNDFVTNLLQYGGYNEVADIMVNLTSLAAEMEQLVSAGYVLTLLAPSDEAMARLMTEKLSEAGEALEEIMYYHVIPEYHTEGSMYSAVRRHGKVVYETLRLPRVVVAEEADGAVRFGSGRGVAHLFDPDISTDGRISVQGIDGVLFPEAAQEGKEAKVADVVSGASSNTHA